MAICEVSYKAHMGNDLTVVNAARVSYGKNKTDLDSSDIKLIHYLAKHKHYSPFEHCSLSVSIKCPLYIRSQIQRHRTFSYNEISRRYTAENLEFYVPTKLRKQHVSSKQCSDGYLEDHLNEDFLNEINKIHLQALHTYNILIDSGVAREQARGVLPQNLMTEFWMTGNLRNWTHFLKLRLDSHAQEEVQDIAKQISDIVNMNFNESYKALLSYGE
jgi:thymidylate synthase (FAD)